MSPSPFVVAVRRSRSRVRTGPDVKCVREEMGISLDALARHAAGVARMRLESFERGLRSFDAWQWATYLLALQMAAAERRRELAREGVSRAELAKTEQGRLLDWIEHLDILTEASAH